MRPWEAMSDDYHPELAESAPDDDRPLRHPATMTAMRVVVIVGILALVLPGIVITASTAGRSADVACDRIVRTADPFAEGSTARFELVGVEGPGWYCYAVDFGGDERLLAALGPIPDARSTGSERAPVQNP